MSDLWERVKKTATEIYTTASERTVEGVNIGVKQLDLVSLRRELSKEFAALGGRVYQLLKREEAGAIPDDPTVLHHLKRLAELEVRLEEREGEIRRLREGRPGSAPTSAGPDPAPGEAPGEESASPDPAPGGGDAPTGESPDPDPEAPGGPGRSIHS